MLKTKLFNTNICIIRKLILYLQCYFKLHLNFTAMLYNLNEEEAELIEIIRNLRRAYPNGYENQLWLAQMLFDKLTDLP